MKLLKRIAIALSAAGAILCCAAVLLFNRPTMGWQLLSVPTGSMKPSISPGSLVLVHRVSDTNLKVGDVITYTNPMTMRTTLTHRIVSIEKPHGILTYTTKGDANPSKDLPVVAGLVQGRMIGHIPFAGTTLLWAKTWPGIVLLVYLPALLIMVHETKLLAAYLRASKPYRLLRLRGRKPEQEVHWPKVATVASALLLAAMSVGWQSAAALSGTVVALSPNHLRVVSAPQPKPPTCSNTTSVTGNNTSTQTGATGSATGGAATTGNVTNNNNTNMNITVRNGC